MLPVLILQAGNPPRSIREHHGSFAEMVCSAVRLEPARVRVARTYAGERPGRPQDYAGMIITGSPANVTDNDPWIAQTAGWIRDAMDAALPMFGICFGHQLMAQALGGRADFHPAGMELGTQDVEQTAAGRADPLLQAVPARFPAHMLHSQTVLEAPPDAVRLACNGHDANQVLRLSENVVSVQFHPEFNAAVMRQYCDVLAQSAPAGGSDFASLKLAVRETPEATGVLARFVGEHMLKRPG